jgi:hypothetical protein
VGERDERRRAKEKLRRRGRSGIGKRGRGNGGDRTLERLLDRSLIGYPACELLRSRGIYFARGKRGI